MSVAIIGSVMLALTTIAGYMSTQRLRNSVDIGNSGKAVYAADAGMEHELYELFVNATSTPVSGSLSSGATYSASTTGGGGLYDIKSFGDAKKSHRAFYLHLSF
jgi:hypothetical protein